MTAPTPSGRAGGLRFTLSGVPVTVRPSIVLILGVLGLGLGSPAGIALWVVIGIASIVLHELGHAIVARAAGASPAIEVAGLGGVTTYRPTGRSRDRRWRLGIALAGPGVGIVIGFLALAVRIGVDPGPGLFDTALGITLFTSFGWSVFNLLPILPLDGGQALQQLLPGDEPTRTKRAAWTGLAFSVALGAAAIAFGQILLVLFAGFFAAQNLTTARSVDARAEAGRRLRAAMVDGDWRTVRDALASGHGDAETATEAQVGAEAAGSLQLAAEIGEVALRNGADDPAVALRTARAWAGLGATDRARAAFRHAVGLGADQDLIDEFRPDRGPESADDDQPDDPPPPPPPPAALG